MKNKWIDFLVKLLSLGFLITWMLLIFWFSAQKGSDSSDVSGHLSYKIVNAVNASIHLEMTMDEKEKLARKMEHPLRKAAHMTEYAILAWAGLVVCIAFEKKDFFPVKNSIPTFGYSWTIVVFYSVTDEIHQFFIPGRNGNVLDVCIDAAGGFLGLLVVFGIANWYNERKVTSDIV